MKSSDVTGSCITGNDVTRSCITGNCVTGSGNDLGNLPATIKISCQNSHFPAKKFEFIVTIQIDQWERFPPKKKYRLFLRTNWKPPLFLSDELGKKEPMKTFDRSNQSEKNPALVFFKLKIHHFFSNSQSERTYC